MKNGREESGGEEKGGGRRGVEVRGVCDARKSVGGEERGTH